MQEQFQSLDIYSKPLKVIATYFPQDKRICDLDNTSIVIKFFLDALKDAGKIYDDHVYFIPEIHYRFGGVAKDFPRMEIQLQELEPEIVFPTPGK